MNTEKAIMYMSLCVQRSVYCLEISYTRPFTLTEKLDESEEHEASTLASKYQSVNTGMSGWKRNGL